MADYNYETKCRRCGAITEWSFGPGLSFVWLQFATAMQDYIDHPRQLRCKPCGKPTVQDVVAYTPPKHQEVPNG